MAKFNFLRVIPVDLKRYLPQFLEHDPTFAATLESLSKEHEKQRLTLMDITKQLFVKTATWGLSDWEEFVGLEHESADTLQTRRQKILRKLQGSQTVTLEFLTKLVNLYVADGQAVVIDHPETYSMEIDIPLIDKERLKKMRQDIDTYIPAHIGPYYKEIEKRLAQQNMAMIKATTKTVDIYPASLEKIEPETPYYVAMAMTMTEELTLTIGGI